MADAETLIDRFLQDQDDIKDAWLLYCVNPYAMAYETAFDAFKETLRKQDEADKAAAKAQAELMLFALSLCGGGILTAAFGTTVLKTLAGEAAISVICRYNMERAFRAADILANNKTAGFIAGKVWDELEKRGTDFVTDQVKNGMAPSAGNYPSTQGVGAVKMSKTLENFVLEAKVKGASIAKALRDDTKLKGEEKLDRLEKLKKSKFYTPPSRSIATASLAAEIELAFYLNLIMDSDSLVSYEKYYRYEHDGLARYRVGDYRVTSRRDITESVHSNAYPKPSSGSVNSFDRIEYAKIGGVIQKQTNALHKQLLKSDIIDGKVNHQTIAKAEKTMEQLGSANIHRLIQNASK